MAQWGGEVKGVVITKESLKELTAELGRDFVSFGKQGARAFAIDLGNNTRPYGLGNSDGLKLKQKIFGDIRRLYPALEDGRTGASRIYSLLEDKVSTEVAQRFWAKYTKQGVDEARKFLTKRFSGLPRKLNHPGHKTARRGKYGAVAKNAAALAYVKTQTRDSYIRKVQKSAGMAKSGWLHAAKGIGGRVRRGGGRSGGTVQVFPRWVSNAGARRKLGSATILSSPSILSIGLRNSVAHIGSAITASDIDRAGRTSKARYERALEFARKHQEKRFNRKSRRAS